MAEKDIKFQERNNSILSDKQSSIIPYTLELWDDQSHALKAVNGSISGEETIATLDVSRLNNGIYLLTLKVDGQITCSSKMIINL